jgi:hypothetical protein
VIEALRVESVRLVAVSVYTPAVAGAVKVTFVPLALIAGLIDPPEPLVLQMTPALSFVLATTARVWVTVSPAWRGVIATVMFAGLTGIVKAALCFRGGLLESVALKVMGAPTAATVG